MIAMRVVCAILRMVSAVRGRRRVNRVVVSAAAAAVFVIAPTVASADDLVGTPGQDNLIGTPGDDTVDGGAGGDSVQGLGGDDHLQGGDDGDAVWGGDGDDTVEGGGGDDAIQGGSGDDTLDGGDGDDVVHGEDGDDIVLGGAGDDYLRGGPGDDWMYGGLDDDVLCGNDGDNLMLGLEGNDLACAVDDAVTVESGEPTAVDVALNDEVLSDELDEEYDLTYALEIVPDGITALIDAVTGVISLTATESGSIWYSVSRETGDLDQVSSWAELVITVVSEDVSTGGQSDAADDSAPVSTAVLPNTGAPDHVIALSALGVAMALGGGTLVRVGGRRR